MVKEPGDPPSCSGLPGTSTSKTQLGQDLCHSHRRCFCGDPPRAGRDSARRRPAQVINAYIVKLGEAHAAEADAKEAKFFAENKTKEGVQETESGLQYQIIDAGNPDLIPGEMDTVQVNYKGIVLGGTKEFDSTYQRGEPATFPVNRVVPGWSEGIKLIGEGGKIKLWIPYKLGYGANAASPDLPGYSTLVFDVELLKVTPYVEKDEKDAKKL